ncbi:MAG: putative AraC family transcriptional regulator [Actinomycetia bacterium]|nr:putative AraC family transcriptional regulator [Actinomycetes bacterium]
MFVIAAKRGRVDAGAVQRVVIFVFDGVQPLDAVGPHEVLRAGGYAVELVSATGQPVRSASGLTLGVDGALADVRGPLDTLVVAGGDGIGTAMADAEVLRHLGRLAARSRRVTSVCSGAFLLAEAGLLDGRRATTHWRHCAELAARYPAITVDPDPIFVRDGDVWTSAGVTAGMDLALALVEEDRGAEAALAIARRLVMYVQRPGGQAQFSAALKAQRADRDVLRELQAWLPDHLDLDLGVDRLAERAAMSPRQFARTFAAEVGVTPGRYVEDLRVEAARRLLESTRRGVDDVATTCGFGTAETMRRAFLRSVRVPPAEYRRRFNKEASA